MCMSYGKPATQIPTPRSPDGVRVVPTIPAKGTVPTPRSPDGVQVVPKMSLIPRPRSPGGPL